jgi:hypothetical protein
MTTPPPEPPPRRRVPTLALILLCFALGAVAAASFAGKLGLSRPAAMLAPADALLAEAEEARARRAWDAPASGNVRDLVGRARSDFPDDPRFLELSRRASVEITMAAVEERQAGRLADALRLARVALSLDDTNATARGLARELSGGAPLPPPPQASASPTTKPPRGTPPAPPPPASAPPRGSASADPPPDGGRWL